MDALKGEVIEGQGNTEANWRSSLPLQSLPVIDLPALLGARRRLVVVAPHPDDEVLGCGGLICSAIEAGYELSVISLTDGEAAYPDDHNWPPSRLAAVRRAELAAAVSALGGDPDRITHVGIADGRIAANLDKALAALAHLGPLDTVLVTWASDGHPDHEAAAQAVLMACARSGAKPIQYPIWAWHWADPDSAAFLGKHARRFVLSEQALARKKQAIDAFRTQVGTSVPAPPFPILPAHVLARFQRPFEVYLT
jgi:LmbE family N-acetylglucosaminyl deacetylase